MSDRDAQRQKRLSEALRANLKRRKSQIRGRSEPRDAVVDSPDIDRPPDNQPGPDEDSR